MRMRMNDTNKIIFQLTVQDFQDVLGRELTEDEVDTCINKFNIDPWWDYVDMFLDIRGIRKVDYE